MWIWHHLFNTSFFVGLATLFVGFAAYLVYSKQKSDVKRNAANILLLEIENAEQQIQKINETHHSNPVLPGISLMKNASWDKYRYLFVRTFDKNEWDNLSDFYNKCLKFDVAVAYQESLFERNMFNIRENLQRVLADYADDHANEMIGKTVDQQRALEQTYIQRRAQFVSTYE